MQAPLLEVRNLKKYFDTPNGTLHAVDDVSFTIEKSKTLGVVGESGCGKSTLGRTILHLLDSTSGTILFNGRDITNVTKAQLKELRRDMQIIFQDPFSSLDPRKCVSDIIAEPLLIYKKYPNRKAAMAKVAELMETVGLAARLAYSYPHELDGGRRQRIGIARALALDPQFIVCDEPVSALDVSIQAQILNLMQDIQQKRKLTYIFITHNLSVVKHISDDIMVMYLGNMIEKADKRDLFRKPLHPYTQALLSAIPIPDIDIQQKRILLRGEVVSPIDPKPGCRFAPRCQYARPECFESNPAVEEVLPNHLVACHRVAQINSLDGESGGKQA